MMLSAPLQDLTFDFSIDTLHAYSDIIKADCVIYAQCYGKTTRILVNIHPIHTRQNITLRLHDLNKAYSKSDLYSLSLPDLV